MSQSRREPQSKLRPPEGAPSGLSPAEVPPAEVPAVGAPAGDVPAADALPAEVPPAEVPAVDVPAAEVTPTETLPAEVPVAGATKPDETKAIVVPAAAPVAPAAAAPATATLPPLPAAAAPAAGPPVGPATPAMAPYPAPATPAPGEAVSPAGDSALDDEPAPPLTLRDRLRRLSPALVTMIVGSVGSTVFLALAVTSHTTPVAVLVGAAVVTTLVFALDAVLCTAVTYRAGQDQEAGRALLFAVLGGISAVICALAMAGTLIMILVLNS